MGSGLRLPIVQAEASGTNISGKAPISYLFVTALLFNTSINQLTFDPNHEILYFPKS